MNRKIFESKFGDLFDFLNSAMKRLNSEGGRDEFFRSVDSAITALDEPEINPKMEYLVKEVFTLRAGRLEASLNSLGEDGWDMVHYDGDMAIFSRIVE